jgi:NADH:ubiquinone oxidoreductase subunit 6 (subunit J)
LTDKNKKIGMNLLFYFFSSLVLVSGIMVIQSRNPVHSVLFLILVFFNAAGLLILLGLDFFAMIFLVVYVGAIAVLFLFVVMMLNIKLAEINEKKLRYLPIGGLLGILFLFEIFLIVDNDLVACLFFNQLSLLTTPPSPSVGLLSFFTKAPPTPFSGSRAGVNFSEEATPLAASLPGAGQLPDSIGSGELSAVADSLLFTEWGSLLQPLTNISALGQVIYTYYFYYFLVASLILLVAMIGAIVLTMHKGVHIRRQEVFEQNAREYAKTVSKHSSQLD